MSTMHLIILLIILLIFFGPNRIEGIGLSLGRAIRNFKKGLEEGEAESVPSSSTASSASSSSTTKQDLQQPPKV